MWIEGILIGLLIGIIRGGRASYLSNLDFKFAYVFILGVAIQILPFFLGRFAFFANNANLIAFIGYLLVFVFLILNIKEKGLKMMALGSFLNLLALALNKFKMPLKISQTSTRMVKLQLAIEAGEIKNYLPFKEFDSFSYYLGKFIHIPDWYVGVPAISIADILVAIGMVILVQWTMVSKKGFFV